MKNKHISLSILFVVLTFASFAQYRTLYNITTVPQAMRTNPAFQPLSRVYVELPQLSGFQFSFTNTGFTYNDIFRQGTGDKADSLIIDLDYLESTLKDKNYFLSDMSINLLGFGFKVRETYISFGISQKSEVSLSYPGSIISLRKGNGAFIGSDNPLDLSGFGANALIYTEVGLGISRVFNDKLTVGAKLKLYNGNANLQTKKSDMKLYTADQTYDMTINTDFELNYSFPMNVTLDENNIISEIEMIETGSIDQIMENFIFNRNFGLGVDLGAVYLLNDKISFSGSIIDLGFIGWNKNTTNLISAGEFEFKGIDFSDEIKLNENTGDNSENKDVFQETVDTLMSTIEFEKTNLAYTTLLPTKVYMGANYKLSDKINFGAMLRTDFYDKTIHPSLSLSANLVITNMFSTTVNYSMNNGTYNNIGLGMMLRGGPFQFYFVNDNISTFIWPKGSKQVNLIMGMNLVFGNKAKIEKALIEDL